MHQTVVAPDLKTAVQISSKLDRSFRIVTPDGQLRDPAVLLPVAVFTNAGWACLAAAREIEDLKQEKIDVEAPFGKRPASGE